MGRTSKRVRHARKVKRAQSIANFNANQIDKNRDIWVNPLPEEVDMYIIRLWRSFINLFRRSK